MIPQPYADALKRVTKGRQRYTGATSKMTREVEEILVDLRKEHPTLFRELANGSVLPRLEIPNGR